MLFEQPTHVILLRSKIRGESSDLVPVHLEKATTGDDSFSLVRSQEVSTLTKVNLASNKISSIYTRLPGSVEALNAMTEM
ncbi:hypothetical protein KXD40_003685 [Peronospora effusa]|nr:hypothetical protein KXD40_003685 [Peronospora effusa]